MVFDINYFEYNKKNNVSKIPLIDVIVQQLIVELEGKIL